MDVKEFIKSSLRFSLFGDLKKVWGKRHGGLCGQCHVGLRGGSTTAPLTRFFTSFKFEYDPRGGVGGCIMIWCGNRTQRHTSRTILIMTRRKAPTSHKSFDIFFLEQKSKLTLHEHIVPFSWVQSTGFVVWLVGILDREDHKKRRWAMVVPTWRRHCLLLRQCQNHWQCSGFIRPVEIRDEIIMWYNPNPTTKF